MVESAAPSALAVDLGDLELSCERTPTTLVPCYGDLVAAVRGRASDFHGVLASTFAQLVSEIFVGQLGAAGLIRGATPSVVAHDGNAMLHIELDALTTQ